MKPIHAKPGLYSYYYEYMKEISIRYGYNLVVHGSMNRDLDLIAIPWVDKVGDLEQMIEEFANVLGGTIMEQPYESIHCFPHGRMSYIINLNRGGKMNNYEDKQYYIDISVMPVSNSEKSEDVSNAYVKHAV